MYRANRALRLDTAPQFPWATLAVNLTGCAAIGVVMVLVTEARTAHPAVNVAGCLVLGFLIGAATSGEVPAEVRTLVGTGFCGALTTYSTLSYETLRLAETGSPP